jgi:hypothetical protein
MSWSIRSGNLRCLRVLLFDDEMKRINDPLRHLSNVDGFKLADGTSRLVPPDAMDHGTGGNEDNEERKPTPERRLGKVWSSQNRFDNTRRFPNRAPISMVGTGSLRVTAVLRAIRTCASGQPLLAARATTSPLGRTRLTSHSDVRQANALIAAWKTDTPSIMFDCDRAQTRLVQMERRAR